jgi:hypothetical protein
VIGLQLHAALALVTDPEARRRVEGALEELDRIVNEVRALVFKDLEEPEQD